MTYLQKKKLAFMSIVNSVKGFVRKVSGIPPLTLPNCVDAESMINYTIEGASGGVGDVTENLFDNKRNWNVTGGKAISGWGGTNVSKIDGGGYRLGRNSSVGFNFTDLIVGETYTLSFDATTMASGLHYAVSSTPNGMNRPTISGAATKRLSATFVATQTTNICFGYSPPSGDYTSTLDITNIMLVQGSTAKAYEPYGYKMPIVCSGKNLLDLPYTTDNRLKSRMDLKPEFSFKVEVGKTYTFSFRYNIPSAILNTGMLVWCLSYGDTYNWAGDTNHIYVFASTTYNPPRYRTFTATKDTVYFIGGLCQGKVNGVMNYTNEYWDFQLEENSKMTTYEKGVTPTTTSIYLDEPLEDGEVINYKEDNLPTLPTEQGTTIYTVETAVQPSNMEVTYYATAKE